MFKHEFRELWMQTPLTLSDAVFLSRVDDAIVSSKLR